VVEAQSKEVENPRFAYLSYILRLNFDYLLYYEAFKSKIPTNVV